MLDGKHLGSGAAVRRSEPGNSVYLDVGVWYNAGTRSIHMTAKGVHGFHTTVRSDTDSKRGHPNLFWKLAACLRQAGAPAPQEVKADAQRPQGQKPPAM